MPVQHIVHQICIIVSHSVSIVRKQTSQKSSTAEGTSDGNYQDKSSTEGSVSPQPQSTESGNNTSTEAKQ
jgi:hypothetical protein